MELYYNENGIGELKEKIRNIGKRLDGIISSYNTVCYEILDEIEVTADDNLRSDINNIKNSLEESFIFLKRHEMFLEEAIDFYNCVSRKTEAETKKLKSDMLYEKHNRKSPSRLLNNPMALNTDISTPDIFIPFVSMPKIIKI